MIKNINDFLFCVLFPITLLLGCFTRDTNILIDSAIILVYLILVEVKELKELKCQ